MPGAYGKLLARLEAARVLGVELGLERVRHALDRLGAPDRSFVSVQIAGTNGKGSTAAMVDAMLRAAGVRTGLFTSPHLCRFTERIRIDGREVDGAALAMLDQAVAATGVRLTYFEISTVLALRAMAGAGVEIAVLETGLGGRLDAVTAVSSVVATAITSIGLDHTDLLGGTLRAIAAEKAGIARPGVSLYVGALDSEADVEVASTAAARGAPLHRLGVEVPPAPVAPALVGAHQQANAALAVALARTACGAISRPLSDAAIAAGLGDVRWPGRMEWLAPDLLLDGAHNAQGAQALARALPPGRRRALVVSVARGKDLVGILKPLASTVDLIVATQSHSERSLDAEAVAAAARALGAPVVPLADAIAALGYARAAVAGDGGFAVVAGSLFLVGEIRARLLGELCDPVRSGDPLP